MFGDIHWTPKGDKPFPKLFKSFGKMIRTKQINVKQHKHKILCINV